MQIGVFAQPSTAMSYKRKKCDVRKQLDYSLSIAVLALVTVRQSKSGGQKLIVKRKARILENEKCFDFFPKIILISSMKIRRTCPLFLSKKYSDRKKIDKTTLLHFAHGAVMTYLALQVTKHNRGGPGTIKINEIC